MTTQLLQLTQNNYYTPQADQDYMSVSQFKGFAGTLYKRGCEAKALARIAGTYVDEPSTDKLVGSYVDAHFEGALDKFLDDNMDLVCTKTSIKKYEEGKGSLELLAPFVKADAIISRLEADPVFMEYCKGDRQVILTGDVFGVPWKIRMDFYDLVDGRISDLKIMKDMQPIWSPLASCKVDFIRYWGYDIQGAIYQEIVRQNVGRKLPFYLCVGTKESPADLSVIEITQDYLDEAMAYVKSRIGRVVSVKAGTVPAVPCGTCDQCRQAKRLSGPVPIAAIIPPGRHAVQWPDGDED